MVILHVKLDNIFGFKDFEINFSYPKKIVNSLIPSEHLPGRPNFRYKKAVILMGANASGKTTLGKALYYIFELIRTRDIYGLWKSSPNKNKKATYMIDFVMDDGKLYRVKGFSESGQEQFTVYSAEIGKNDSYEKSVAMLQPVYPDNNLFQKLKYRFAYPDISQNTGTEGIDENQLLKVLCAVLGTLDPTLQEITIARELKNSFIIRRKDEEIIIQDGKLLNGDALSSGTIEGIDIALFLASIMQGDETFYYCDEHFSYIQSDIEKRIFGIMLDHLGDYDQLIFTTHNMEMLDLNLPKHAYAFLRKKADENGDYKISAVYADEYLKRNTDSIRSAVGNDIFASLPDDSLLDQLDREYAA